MLKVRQVAGEVPILMTKLMQGVRGGITSPRFNIASSQLVILMTLYDRGPRTISELAREKGVALPTVTGIIDRMIRDGYVTRNHDTEDRRRVYVQIAPCGRKAVKRLQETIKKRWSDVLEYLNQKELQEFMEILKKLIGIITQQEAHIRN